MTDIERGVVWEESIILLDRKVTLVFLSATIANANDFAAWITDLKTPKICRVIGTNKRPVPLEHYIFPKSADGLFLVSKSDNVATKSGLDLKERSTFLAQNFERGIYYTFKDRSRKSSYRYKQMVHHRRANNIGDLERILKLLHTNDWLPVIVFAFSRKEVEGRALTLNTETINFSTKQESQVCAFFILLSLVLFRLVFVFCFLFFFCKVFAFLFNLFRHRQLRKCLIMRLIR